MELPKTSLDRLTAAFKALGVQAPSLLTKIGILRSLFIEIESAKKDGYSYGLILETLIANGLKKTTPNQFYGLMNRIRLERGFAHLENQPEKKIAPATPVRSHSSGALAPQEVVVAQQLEPEQQKAGEDDNPLIAMGIGTSHKEIENESQVNLTFTKRDRVNKS